MKKYLPFNFPDNEEIHEVQNNVVETKENYGIVIFVYRFNNKKRSF